jgi:hypothetical protein
MIRGASAHCRVIWFAPSMTWKREHPTLAAFYRHPTTQKAKAVLEDTGLVVLIILCYILVGFFVDRAGMPSWLHDSLSGLKGFSLLILYTVFFVQLLNSLKVFDFLTKLYNIVKGKSHGSNPILAA